MARNANEKMFTREIAYTTAVCKVINVNAENTETKEFTLPIETDDAARAKAFLKKYKETDEMLIVSVQELKIVRKMYGCTIEDFLKVAKELDPETRKPLNK